jgi:hypothetical protein
MRTEALGRKRRRPLPFCRVCTLFLSEMFKPYAPHGHAGFVDFRGDMIVVQATSSFGAIGPDSDDEGISSSRRSCISADAVGRASRVYNYYHYRR